MPDGALATLVAAAREIEACSRVLARAGETLVGRVAGRDAPEPWRHYPPGGDVYDPVSHAQYYFHVHPDAAGEAGHFHTFLRPAGMPAGLVPEVPATTETGDPAPSHLVAVAVDARGQPVRLFTTNRWVTGEAWYPAAAVTAMLERFAIDRQQPSWAVNRWLTALFTLFRAEMAALLEARDEALRRRLVAAPGGDAREDRGLETASTMRVDLARQIAAVDAAARRRG
ncbi:MAG: hypothetical protein IT561_26345 [Alphaproteobacteria bacterium]|nr:hypothetical protein [Alphaproteobacteria bacterium]